MNNIIKIGLKPLLVFTVIAIGLLGISIPPTVEDVPEKKRSTVILRKILLLSV
jgi:hypothetical protein